jgi:hypothetical protein
MLCLKIARHSCRPALVLLSSLLFSLLSLLRLLTSRLS